MRSEFSVTLQQMLAVANKSVQQVSDLGGVDAAYLRRLLSGAKGHPSPETVLRLWIGIIFDEDIIQNDPTMIHGLAALMEAAAMSAAAFRQMEEVA